MSQDGVNFREALLAPERYERSSWQKFDILEEMRRRAEILKAASKDLALQAGLREMCKRDIAFFANNFCWIYEPRPGMEHILPWVMYPHELLQIDFMNERFRLREDGLTEKSREMGATWTACLWSLHHFLFDEEFSVLIGSRVEDLVDNKLMDSIFGKIDFLLQHIPTWLRPHGFDFLKHRTYMKIVHPKNYNSITGESTNQQFSRSGRYSSILLDEFAFTERSH